MALREEDWVEVDQDGRLVLPAAWAEKWGLKPGARARLEGGSNHIKLHRPVSHLAKVYIEPTIHCNLNCVICIRNNWDETKGRMSAATFQKILAGVRQLDPLPVVFFGGLGEPLSHPHTVDWVCQAKEAGAWVELITNGTMLTPARSRQLIDGGLDVLWVSIDGASPESYADVRLGAELPNVLKNLDQFRRLRKPAHRITPEIGIAFVAMQRNIADLPEVVRIGKKLGATRFSISNVLPYTAELQQEALYHRTLRDIAYMDSIWQPKLNMPKIDLNKPLAQEAFVKILNSGCNINFAGNALSGSSDVCNFIESGTISIRWDGGVAPCWPLMHDHISYLHGKERRSHKHIIGNVQERSLLEIWMDPAYMAYRERVHSFSFAPCTFCGGCEMAEQNLEDCLGNEFPVCGGCLWAQGVIQCP